MSVLSTDVLQLVDFGLYPVRLHYPVFEQDRVLCSCGDPACSEKKSQGKHPVGNSWGKTATQDAEIISSLWGSRPWNVGIVVGLCHGIPADEAIIDIENDTEEGRMLADVLLEGVEYPCYTSGKSIHRLFRWDPALPPLATMTVKGLEFRFGGKGLQSQSVAPPSIHPSGKTYQWIEGNHLQRSRSGNYLSMLLNSSRRNTPAEETRGLVETRQQTQRSSGRQWARSGLALVTTAF